MIAADGGIEVCAAHYVNASKEVIACAMEVESVLIDVKRENNRNFVKMAYLLDLVDSEQLFLARGFPTLRAKVASPELDVSTRLAHGLLRIKRGLIPLLSQQLGNEQDAIGTTAPVTITS